MPAYITIKPSQTIHPSVIDGEQHIPNEIMTEIFFQSRFFVLSEKQSLMAVCRRWRSIALACRSLWTVLDAETLRSPFYSQLHLKHSLNLPLTLSVLVVHDEDHIESDPLFSLPRSFFLDSFQRFRHIHIGAPPRMISSLIRNGILRGQPLESLTLYCTDSHSLLLPVVGAPLIVVIRGADIIDERGQSSFHTLAHLKLVKVFLDPSIWTSSQSLCQLAELSADVLLPSARFFLSALHRMSNLKHVTIINRISAPPSVTVQTYMHHIPIPALFPPSIQTLTVISSEPDYRFLLTRCLIPHRAKLFHSTHCDSTGKPIQYIAHPSKVLRQDRHKGLREHAEDPWLFENQKPYTAI
jgi:hypothetical protein